MAIGNIGNDVIQTFGTAAQPIQNEHPSKRENVMEFRRGSLSVTLSMGSFWDAAKNEYGPYTAGISVGNNKRYSSLPADPKVLLDLSEWLKLVAKAVEGAPTRDRDRTDVNVDEAKRIIAKYKV
ncbi:MAG: hypothetical protein IKQ93_09705 [Candidatus Methanomethylophilaceae archaeon]|nr:hypothetical protein [Candidatus Methanomethylophilaceae archaeon]